MNCLHCGRKMNTNENDWHEKCIKTFFGTKEMPSLDFSNKQLTTLAKNSIKQGLAITGVQKKLSLHLQNKADVRLTIVDYPTGYILKPPTEDFDSLPEFEDLAMRLAKIAGIQTVPHGLVKVNKKYAYITKRIDRDIKNDIVKLYAMEDFCQISKRLTQDKYRGSYESCGRVIKDFSIRPGLDLSELFLRIGLSFIIGNSDMHLKNFSLIEQKPATRAFALSMAYDLLPVNIIMPEDKEQFALTLNGKKRNIRRKDFIEFAQNCQISKKSAENMLIKLCSLKDKFLLQCDNSYLTFNQKLKMQELITERISTLTSSMIDY